MSNGKVYENIIKFLKKETERDRKKEILKNYFFV